MKVLEKEFKGFSLPKKAKGVIMDIARRLMNNSIRSFKDFIINFKEIELKDILKELNSNELEKILNASHDENLSKKY